MTLPKCKICDEVETPEAILFWHEFDEGEMALVHNECIEKYQERHCEVGE